jgi:hypothetical protein
VIQGLPPFLGRLDEDPQVILNFFLTNELRKALGPQAHLQTPFLFHRFGIDDPIAFRNWVVIHFLVIWINLL